MAIFQEDQRRCGKFVRMYLANAQILLAFAGASPVRVYSFVSAINSQMRLSIYNNIGLWQNYVMMHGATILTKSRNKLTLRQFVQGATIMTNGLTHCCHNFIVE